MLRFVVPGEPQAWQRVTRGKGHGKPMVPKETREFETTVAQYGQLAINTRRHAQIPGEILSPYPQSGNFWLGVILYLGTYKVGIGRHCFDGDLDNYIKAICDGLQGIVWHNDKQVVGYLPGTHKRIGCNHPQTHIFIVHDAQLEEHCKAWREFPKL